MSRKQFSTNESFENEDNILRDWAKDKVQKGLAKALNRFEKDKAPSFKKCFRKIFLSSFSRPLSETKPRTNLVLVNREPLLYLEFSKPNKQNVSKINLFETFNFFQSQKNCCHTD